MSVTRLRRRTRALAVVLALAGLAGFAAIGATMATASAPPSCPAGMTCITGKLLIRDPGSDTPHQLLIEDKNGAAMLWVDYGGVGSGGEPFCVYSLTLHPLSCLGGRQGSYGGQAAVTLYLGGRPVTLTAQKLAGLLTLLAHAREARR